MIDQGEKMAAHLLNKCNQTAADLKRKYGLSLYMERPNRLLLKCEKCGHMKNIEFPYNLGPSEKYELPCGSCGDGIMSVVNY